MRCSLVPVFLLSAAMGFANMIATVTTTTSGFAQSVQNTGEFSVGASLDGGSAGGSYDGGNLFHLGASASKGLGLGQVIATSSFTFQVLVIGTDQPGYLLMLPTDSASTVLIGPNHLQTYTGNVQGVAFGGGSNSNHPPLFLYVPYQPGVPVTIYASLSAIAGAADVSFPGDMSAGLDVFVSSAIRSEMSEGAVIRDASWIVVPEPATFGFITVGLILVGGLRRYWPRRVSTGSTAAARRAGM